MKKLYLSFGLLLVMLVPAIQVLSQTYTFTPAGATGLAGPTQSQINTAYAATNLNGQVTSVGGIQEWTITSSGIYKIEAYGAQGYGPFGGRGAMMSGEFQFYAGDQIRILVGQYGACCAGSGTNQYGGGGGSFVTDMSNTPYIVAGGGGGSWASTYTATTDASITTSGNAGQNGPGSGAGGTAGGGGAASSSADGGGGLLGNGGGTAGGFAFVNGGNGGTAANGGTGGFGGGGGGSSWDNRRGCGGGGYSGGGGAGSTTTGFPEGGGGGSYNVGNNPNNLAGVQLGDGMIVITKISGGAPYDAAISSIPSLSGLFCANDVIPVDVTVSNYGSEVLDSVMVTWQINGVIQSSQWVILNSLDTAGSGNNDTVINLGTLTIAANTLYTVEAWTSLPNNILDTVAVNDTAEAKVKASLSGTYFIASPPPPGAYPTFDSAAKDLSSLGVCGPVTFIVNDGIYAERVVIGDIPGASATDSILFTSLNSVSDVTLIHTPSGSADNYTLNFAGADHVTFNDITIATGATGTYTGVLDITSGSSFNRIDNCILAGATPTTTSEFASVIHSNGSVDSMNIISNNTVVGGSYGMYLRGVGTGIGAKKAYKVIGNTVADYYYMGLYMYYHRDLEEAYNESSPATAYSTVYRFYNYYCDGKLRFHHNKSSLTKSGYGAYIAYCSGTATEPGYVYNNSLSVGDPATTSASYGLSIYYCNYQVVANNSVNVSSNGTSTRALYHYYGSNNRIMNNIFATSSPSYAIYTYGSPVLFSDNNNYYHPNGALAYDNGSYVNTLADWQNNYGYDLNSYDVDPQFTSFEDLTTCVDDFDKSALVDSLVTDDYAGHLRGSMPDIGAFEFDGIAKFSIGADTVICPQDLITIGDPTSTSSWIWNTSGMTNTITVNGPGTYIAQITNSCGVGVDTITIGHLPTPNADFDFTTSYLTGIFTDQSAGADSWFWDFGDGNTSTLQNPIHVYNTTGLYDVTLTISGICGTVTYTGTVQIWINGVDDLEAIDFNMYPNPASDNVMLTSGTALKNATVEVMDAAGRIVVSTNAIGNVINLNVGDLETGAYFVRITDEGKSTTKQLIVK